jgi:hypothetical protein
MTQPATGTSWDAAGLNDIDNRFAERGGLQAVAIRDYRGAATDISPFESNLTTVNFSPFAVDGTIRGDLFARKLVDGVWTDNTDPNQGWFFLGAQTENGGAERDPNMKSDDLMILQSNYPFDSEVIQKGKTVKFTSVHTADPLIQRLEADLRLQDDTGASLVPTPGGDDYGVGSRADTDTVERQLLLFFAKRKAGKFLYRVEGYPLVKFDNQARKRRSKTDPDTAELTYKVLPDPYFMIPDPDGEADLVPGVDYVWYSGGAWADMAVAGS